MFEAPRRREFPLPPLLVDRTGVVFDAATKKLGYHPFSTPRAILSEAYKGPPGCTYCGFCQAFGCHIGAKSSILVTALPEAEATGDFELVTGAMCYRVNSDDRTRDRRGLLRARRLRNTIEAELVILTPFIYDNTRLLLLSKTEKFPNGLANSSGQVGKHLMAHMMPNVYVAFDDRHMNNYMGPSAQKHTIDDFNADNFDHASLGFIRGSQISVGTGNLQGGPISLTTTMPPPGTPRWAPPIATSWRSTTPGTPRWWRRPRTCPCRPDHRSRSQRARCLGPAGAAPDLRWRRPTELARVEFMMKKMEEIGARWAPPTSGARRSARALRAHTMRAAPAWAAIRRPRW